MDNKSIITDVNVKQEPNSSKAKKVLLSTSSFATLASKNVSNARLPSFKPPRDLFLTGSVTSNSNSTFNFNSNAKSTKRTFVPNINVTRKKLGCETATDSKSDINQKNRDKEKNKKAPYNKGKRNTNVIQTKGVFSEGLAPGKVKGFGNSSGVMPYEAKILDKPKLNLTKTINKVQEESKMKLIFRDDFIDDPSQAPDINFKPKSLPMIYSVKERQISDDLEKTFESLQVKNEKISNLKMHEEKLEKPILGLDFAAGQGPKMLLFEFPTLLKERDDITNMKKTKAHPSDADNEDEKSESLSSLGEGFFGYLRIHENGRAFLVLGRTTIPLCQIRHETRQEIVSAAIDNDTLKGEVISLGTIDSSFTCSANIFQSVS